jgi:hypothetical protein
LSTVKQPSEQSGGCSCFAVPSCLLRLKYRKGSQFLNELHHYLYPVRTSFEKNMYLCTIINIKDNIKEMERKRINRLKVVLAEKGMTNKQLEEILAKILPLSLNG